MFEQGSSASEVRYPERIAWAGPAASGRRSAGIGRCGFEGRFHPSGVPRVRPCDLDGNRHRGTTNGSPVRVAVDIVSADVRGMSRWMTPRRGNDDKRACEVEPKASWRRRSRNDSYAERSESSRRPRRRIGRADAHPDPVGRRSPRRYSMRYGEADARSKEPDLRPTTGAWPFADPVAKALRRGSSSRPPPTSPKIRTTRSSEVDRPVRVFRRPFPARRVDHP